jgi:hypothetical protein
MLAIGTLFDVVSTIEATASAAILCALLSLALAATPRGRLRVAGALTVWFTAVVFLGASGALNPLSGAGTPGLGLAVTLPLAVLCFAFLGYAPTRDAISQVPLAVLIAVNIPRVEGVAFLLLHSAHRLPAPFALAAGWGDVVVGVTAGPLAWLAWRYPARAKPWVIAWNLLGFADLMVAIGLGSMSAPGPIRLFMDPPGSGIMTTLPWILVPCFLVPCWEALHVAIFSRLLARQPYASAALTAA